MLILGSYLQLYYYVFLTILQIGFSVDLVCEDYTFGWRIALGLEGLLGAVFALGMCSFPETPRYKHGS